MKTYLDCLPCFLRQALVAARATTDDEKVHRQVLDAVAEIIPELPLDVTPPQAGQRVYRVVTHITGVGDPYHKAKQESNRAALDIYPRLKRIVADSADPLLAACKLAIAGNAIDLGAQSDCEDIGTIVESALSLRLGVDHYREFREGLERASRVVYLGDNAGEIVFDRLLIEEIHKIRELEIHFVVREGPIINDATREDAEFVGMDKVANVISSGSDVPATVLSDCSPEMLSIYGSADVIVSKGQGNYEALSEQEDNIFFLLKIKCPVAARLAGASVGDAILKGQRI